MDKIFKWIEKHKKITILIFVSIAFLPIVITNLLFKLPACCYWTEAEWEAGEMLGYFGDVMSFLATAILGYATLSLSDKANKQNEKLIQMQNNQEKSVVIIDQNAEMNFYTKNKDPILPQVLQKKAIDYCFDYVEDTLHTRDIMIIECRLKNITNNYVTGVEINLFDIVVWTKDEITIKPLNGLEEEGAVFIGEKGTQDIRFNLIGLRSILSKEQWKSMKYEFGIKCILTTKNVFNQKTKVYFEANAIFNKENKKIGKRIYTISNYEYKEL